MHPSKLTKVDIESMEAYKFHKELAAKRGKDFEKDLNYLKEHQALVVMDFKANISLAKVLSKTHMSFLKLLSVLFLEQSFTFAKRKINKFTR